MQILKKFFNLLSLQERKQAILVFIMILIMALLEVIGVASIFPFMAVLTNPTLINSNSLLNWMFEFSGIFGKWQCSIAANVEVRWSLAVSSTGKFAVGCEANGCAFEAARGCIKPSRVYISLEWVMTASVQTYT